MKKNAFCTLYIVRHGESENNVREDLKKEFVIDKYGSALTEKGKAQASKLASKLKSVHFDAIFSSDLTRAKETAKILRLVREIAVQTTEVIRERNYGKWHGRYHLIRDGLQKKIGELAEEEKMSFVYDDVETEKNAVSRLITFIREIAVAYSGKNVLVVCHAGIMRMFLIKLGYASYHEIPPHSLENTGYFVLESDGTDFLLKEVRGVHRK